MRTLLVTFCFASWAHGALAAGPIYTCKDAADKMYYADMPCSIVDSKPDAVDELVPDSQADQRGKDSTMTVIPFVRVPPGSIKAPSANGSNAGSANIVVVPKKTGPSPGASLAPRGSLAPRTSLACSKQSNAKQVWPNTTPSPQCPQTQKR